MGKELTDWIEHNPWEPGVYQRLYPSGAYFCRWNGRNWYIGRTNAQYAANEINRSDLVLPWRGLAVNPNAKS